MRTDSLPILLDQIIGCVRCPRLVRHSREVAAVKRRAWLAWDYWGKPVPSFGDPQARLLIVGLAPGAHGSNRTGRMFTGDRSGDFLYRAMHRAGFASQPTSTDASDGLELNDAWITAVAHCAPPDNKPTPVELKACRSFLQRELKLLTNVKVVIALGRVAFDNYLAARAIAPKPPFGHNVLHQFEPLVLCSYHPSQQNTSTGKLTQGMLDEVFLRARDIIQS